MPVTYRALGRFIVVLAALASMFPAAAISAPPPAAARIEARATVTYFNAQLGIQESVSTNIVVTRVKEVKSIETVFDQTVYLAPGSIGQFAFYIRNVGNVAVSPSAVAEQLSGDDADLAEVAAIIDQNRNGAADPGEWELTPDMAIELAAGTELPVIVQFETPAAGEEGDTAGVRLSARDGDAAGAATGMAVISSAGLVLEKSANRDEVPAGGTLRYSLRLRNNGVIATPGYSQIEGNAIRVDGSPASGVLVRDPRPLNTRVTAVSATGGFIGLYHIEGQPQHSYVKAPPGDRSKVDAVAFFRAGDYPAGFSANLEFEVAVAGNIQPGAILNTASTWQKVGGDWVKISSNLVKTPVEGGSATLTYTAPDGTPITSAALDSNVRLKLDAAACNITDGVDRIPIRIATDPEADLETVLATETGSNTGLFTTTLIPIQRVLPAVEGDNILSGDRSTKASASATCGGQNVSAVLTVNPGGFVFHSASNAAVSGATVIIRNASGAEIERTVSDVSGFYVVSAADTAGTYRIEVLPPEGLAFPSTRTTFPAWGRNLDPDASYGRPFKTTGPFTGVDIPVDPDGSAALRLEQSVDQAIAAPGDILVYTLTLTNTTGIGLLDAFIHAGLPKGITYLEGTLRLDGKPVKVSGFPGRNLVFDVGFVGPNGAVTLTYMAVVDPTASGQLANIAHASGHLAGRGAVRSNDARAVVRIERDGGVFSDEGVVLGKVYIDFNENGRQDRYLPAGGDSAKGALEHAEPGIPGVKLQFSTGASVVTDIEGKYSMPGLPPGAHVVAISTATLPATVESRSTSARDALSPRSRYLRMLPGQVASEYFAVTPRKGVSRDEVLAELEARRQAYAENVDPDGNAPVPERLELGGEEWVDYFGRLSSSRGEATKNTETQIVARDRSENGRPPAAVDTGTPKALALERTRDLEAEIKGLSAELGFLDLESDSLLNSDIVSIRVKGPAEGKLGLNLNGKPVSEGQVGQRVVYSAGGVQAAEYVAVRLEGGRNTLEATFSDPFGNVRGRREITVLAAGRPARIELVAPPAAFADPASPIPVLIRFVDAEGVATEASMDVTLEASGQGRWGADDIRTTEPGVQIFVDKGEALVDYYPPALSGTHRIAVRNGLGRFETEVKLLADDSRRIIAGVVEGVVRLPGSVEPATGLEGFDGVTTGVDGELYLQGKIKGDALLTLRYDGDLDTEERLFRDIDPERYYPVYGDASERGYDAQSRSRLYVKVEKGLNYVLYGDIDISPQASEFQLGSHSRLLTGARAHVEAGPVTIDLFAGRTDQSQVIREFRAEGLSGPYDLDLTGYAEGSEQVEVITRDRRQPSVVVDTVLLKRFDDYRLDYFGNSIIFNAPVPAFDGDGNPNFIRVTYELETDGDPYWVYAGEARYRVNDRIAVGYREIRSEAERSFDDRRTVRAGYVSADLGAYGKAEVEVAQTVDKDGETGLASRLGYEVKRERVTLRVGAARADEDFAEGSSLSPGSAEVNVSADWNVSPRLKITTSALYDQQMPSGNERFGVEVLPSWMINPELTVSAGMRIVRLEPGDGEEPRSVPSGVLGAEWSPAALPSLALKGEVEADLTDFSHLRALLEASYQVNERVKIYTGVDWATSGSEFLDFSSADGATGTMKTGVEYRLNDDVKTFGEMRGGSQTGFAGGVAGDWEIGHWDLPGWIAGEDTRVYASIERFQPYDLDELIGLPFGVDDDEDTPQTTLAAGYLATLRDGNARLGLGAELSFKDGGYTAYGQQYWSQRAGEWTWAVENRLATADTDTQQRLRDHLRIGAALRPDEESIDALFLGGIRVERDFATDIDADTAYWSAAGSWALGTDMRITAKQAGQFQAKSVGDVTGDTFVLLAQTGVERDFELEDELRLRLGFNGTLFYDPLTGQSHSGVGAEIGFVPAKNVILAAGYNLTKVNASSVSEIYTAGPYIRLSIKLDDSLWGFFDRAGLTVPVEGESR